MIKVWMLVWVMQGGGGFSVGDFMTEAECRDAGKGVDARMRVSGGRLFAITSSTCVEVTRITSAAQLTPATTQPATEEPSEATCWAGSVQKSGKDCE